jgi:HPt (histidine-containing phosphotransfer) domain-containing protein
MAVDSGNEQDILDSKRMQDLVNNLGDGLLDVIESFLEDAPRQIEELGAAFERGDREDLQRIAHSLKSSSGIFGAHQMVALCRAVEIGARDGGTAGTEPVTRIAETYEKVRVVLNLYLEKS